jgi:hypothetical protein
MADHFGRQAVVIGGSLAGLMTARVLADHFDTVTILERDCIESGPMLRPIDSARQPPAYIAFGWPAGYGVVVSALYRKTGGTWRGALSRRKRSRLLSAHRQSVFDYRDGAKAARPRV